MGAQKWAWRRRRWQRRHCVQCLHPCLTFSTILAHCVPLPAAGAPAIMTRSGWLAAITT